VPATQKEWIKRLQQDGWTRERGGKHQVKMTKPGQRPITLPDHKRRAYSKGFEAQLRRQAGLQDGPD
jgi:predicted RNA binding protein YcfA (HicA-like mRNA interferase family)